MTLSLVFGAAVIWMMRRASSWGVIAGVFRRDGRSTRLVMVVGLIGISMPVFWLGEVVNLVTQSRLHGSSSSRGCRRSATCRSPTRRVGWFKALLFPWLTLAILYIGIYARVLRSAIVEAQEEDYVRTARAKGLTERRVLFRHALRSSLIAFVSLFGLDFGALVGGGGAADRGRLRAARRRLAHLRLAAEPRPAGDHRDRDVRGVLRRARERGRRPALRLARPEGAPCA